ncbi:MAG: KH domain-containing protein [Thermoflavifilum sp.]|nr:KH domain-containing protein [Thermoflavifilum sp.]MCL6513346.1 KH domain-containing protein [Alicyclobacillus sp.]
MKELIEFLAKSLVDQEGADQVQVVEERRSDGVRYTVRVAPGQLGRVIGKQGRTAKAIRQVVSSVASRTGDRVWVDIGGADAREGDE